MYFHIERKDLFFFFLIDTRAVFLFEVLRYMKWNEYCLFSKKNLCWYNIKKGSAQNFTEAERDTYKTKKMYVDKKMVHLKKEHYNCHYFEFFR